jgi:aminopeptidase YwaD
MSSREIVARQLEHHLDVLCRDIGTRIVGSPQEAQAADYIASVFRSFGLETEIQEFPCITYSWDQVSLRVRHGKHWRTVPVQPNSHSPATNGEIEGDVVFLGTGQVEEMAGQELRGKIGLLFGVAYASLERMKRICDSGLAALLYVDDRFATDWNIASGMIAGWVDYLTLPTATVPYMAAWGMVKNGVDRARIDLGMHNRYSRSQNVVATLPGKRRLPHLVLGGHHDSVALGTGAEDDGSGVAVVLEIARALSEARPLRTVKFTTLGWEENLSEGARQYVANPANHARKAAVMFNFDALGSWLGSDHIHCIGDATLRRYVDRQTLACGFVAATDSEVSPYSDQYAFNLAGVPSVWFHRTNTPGGRWFHHSEHDQPEVINFDHLAATANTALGMVDDLAHRVDLPFERTIPAVQQRQIVKWRQDLYDSICDWQTRGLMRPNDVPLRKFE